MINLSNGSYLEIEESQIYLVLKCSVSRIVKRIVYLILIAAILTLLFTKEALNENLLFWARCILGMIGITLLLNTGYVAATVRKYRIDFKKQTMHKDKYFLGYKVYTKEYKWIGDVAFFIKERTSTEEKLLSIWFSVIEMDSNRAQGLIEFYDPKAAFNFTKELKHYFPEVRLI